VLDQPARARSASGVSSSGACEIPAVLDVKTMTAGTSGASDVQSCSAPLGSRCSLPVISR
jgi:hypothetical protein